MAQSFLKQLSNNKNLNTLFSVNGPPSIQTLDISDMSNRNATVNVTIDLPYLSEHQPTTKYILQVKSLDFPDEGQRRVYSLNLTAASVDRITSKSALLLGDCHEHTGWPQSTAQPVSDNLSLYYNTTYQFNAVSCGDDMCSGGAVKIGTSIFRTVEHVPTCPPLDMTLTMTGKTSLKLTYRKLDVFCLHGRATGYGFLLFETVRNYRALDAPWNLTAVELKTLSNFSVVLNEETLEHQFEGLYSYWNYTLIGFAVNGIGNGFISDPVNERTDEDSKLLTNISYDRSWYFFRVHYTYKFSCQPNKV